MLRAALTLTDVAGIEDALFGLTMTCERQIRAGMAPALYTSGVRYQREPPGRENFQTAVQTYQLRSGDCEDLSVYLCGQLWVMGERGARPKVIDVRPGLKHCVVLRASGAVEDPSKRLGMNGAG
jgi:hypothetical protein